MTHSKIHTAGHFPMWMRFVTHPLLCVNSPLPPKSSLVFFGTKICWDSPLKNGAVLANLGNSAVLSSVRLQGVFYTHKVFGAQSSLCFMHCLLPPGGCSSFLLTCHHIERFPLALTGFFPPFILCRLLWISSRGVCTPSTRVRVSPCR